MNQLKKIQFIYPKFRRFYQVLREWSPIFAKKDYEAHAESRTPPCLGFPIVAALTPPGIEIDFVDDRIDDLDMNNLDADLYCLHVKTEMAPRAYELADELRAAGKTVVLGGLHVTYRPEEASERADAVCVGDAEGTWERILTDYRADTLQRIYRRDVPVDMAEVPIPDRSIPDRYKYSKSGELPPGLTRLHADVRGVPDPFRVRRTPSHPDMSCTPERRPTMGDETNGPAVPGPSRELRRPRISWARSCSSVPTRVISSRARRSSLMAARSSRDE